MNLIKILAVVKFLAIEKLVVKFSFLADNLNQTLQPCQIWAANV
jgi:hypothetical protein